MPGPVFIPQTDYSDQAETSSHNPIASGIRMRTLIELQVISHLLSKQTGDNEDLRNLRQSIAVSMLDIG